MAQKDHKKKMPSMAANAIMHLAKLAAVGSHHLRALFAFCFTHGTVLIAHRRCIFSVGSLTYVLIRSKYVSLDVFDGNLEAVETLSFRRCDFCGKVGAEVLIDNAIRCCKKS